MTPMVDLDRRIYAAAVDLLIVLAASAAIGLSVNPINPSPVRAVWLSALVVLAMYSIVELFTGRSIGKRLFGFTLTCTDGGQPTLAQFVVRGIIRLFPVAMMLGASLIRSIDFYYFAAVVTFILAACYFPACYISIMRRGVTIFDALAGTRVVRLNPNGTGH